MTDAYDFASGVDVSEAKDGGIVKVIKTPGDASAGRPNPGDRVSVHYVGTLLDGTKFDSSRDRDSLFEFKLGEGQVIKAWDEGVASMDKGEVALLKCAPEYAYGESGSPPKIPANATLVFEVELFHWKGEDLSLDLDEGILKTVLRKGKGYKHPEDGDTIEARLEGRRAGEQATFDERVVNFVMGEGEDHDIFEGLETALKSMSLEERAVVTFQPKYAFGEIGSEKWGLAPNAEINYTIELTQLDRGKEAWEMDAEEKLTTSVGCKAKGSQYFKEGKLERAVKQYNRVTEYLSEVDEFDDESKAKAKELLLAAHLNLAMCHLKAGRSYECIQSCENALDIEPNNVKGHFRRGEALILQKDWESARDEFESVLALEPENKAAKNKSSICAHRVKEEKAKEKKAYQRIFQTMFAENEAKEEKKGKNEEKESVKGKQGKENGLSGVAADERDPAAGDAEGLAEAEQIPVLSQS